MISGINASELKGNQQGHNAEEKKLRKGREEVLPEAPLAGTGIETRALEDA